MNKPLTSNSTTPLASLTRRGFLKTAGLISTSIAFKPATFADTLDQSMSATAIPGSNRPVLDPKTSDGAIVSLKFAGDSLSTEQIAPKRRLGDVLIHYQTATGTWQTADTTISQLQPVRNGDFATGALSNDYTFDFGLELTSGFVFKPSEILWTVTVKNNSVQPIKIGDLALLLPMNTDFTSGQPATSSVLKHSFISGHGSFLFWTRPNSIGPYLMATPLEGTSLEYWDTGNGYRVYVHSAETMKEATSHGCHWRQPSTSLPLSQGESQTYGLRFEGAADYNTVRNILVDNGLIDITVVPGMTIPSDLTARMALRSKKTIHSIVAEFPEQTRVTKISSNGAYHIYDVQFSRLGENSLKVQFGEGSHVYLEFFSCEPVETLIKKRAQFTASHQHRDPAKWYNGLLAEWNMLSQTMLGPDNYDKITGWRIYEVTCDDPGLSKPAFLAAKNAEYPVQNEIDALDYYIEHFLWGGLQRTTKEKYSYGIYGIPDWKTNRDSANEGTDGQLHLWRIYDYSHIILLYLSLYKAASNNPGIRTAHPASEYLTRAAGTAIALFTVPNELVGWSAYETGLYNELCIVELIGILDKVGRVAEAAALRGEWMKKVEFFVNNSPNLFGSEYPFDSTGFESTHAIAKYALSVASDSSMPSNPIKLSAAKKFMSVQMNANIFCRGWLEPAYYLLGSDYRASAGDGYTLSYMAQMGGWSVLDFALNYADDPFPYLRLGYASFLSSWALMNTGTAESNYGYWFPGPENDGGAGGGFEPAAFGYTWLGQPHHRGSWYYSCEINLGYCGALRTAAAIVADDPIFGRICYGGAWRQKGNEIEVMPMDGVRRRFHALLSGSWLSLISQVHRFSAGYSLAVGEDLTSLSFTLEPNSIANSTTELEVSGLMSGTYLIKVNGKEASPIRLRSTTKTAFTVPTSATTSTTVSLIRKSA